MNDSELKHKLNKVVSKFEALIDVVNKNTSKLNDDEYLLELNEIFNEVWDFKKNL